MKRLFPANMSKAASIALAAAASALALGSSLAAYTTGSAKWPSSSVLISVNPQNADVDPSLAEAAVLAAINEWNTRSGSNFEWVYNGRTNLTSTGYDGRNIVLFRNSGDGSALATTYTWWSGSLMLDADIVFWDGAFAFFSGTSGCNGGAYIEDVATHELGHALGLKHSTVVEATMYPSYSYCSQDMRSLAADDIAGAQALYGKAGASNTAPSVSISAPANGTNVAQGEPVFFAGWATDAQDGDLTGSLSWRSSIDGTIGSGGQFSRTLSAGTHTITASVLDSAGASTSSVVSVTVAAAAPSGPVLTARGYKQKGTKMTDLSWNGLSDTTVSVWRDGGAIATTANDGSFTDTIRTKGGGTYRYTVCGTTSTVCTNTVTVTF